ncbi:MAG: MmgE/PrpD family protein, partial [Nitriliruptorales bacterium]|nr:MmgE/PrpD family protein [Nitriliruptorales bacterium]
MSDETRPAMTMTLAAWAAGLRSEALPDEVVHQAKRVILDYLAATIAGSASGTARIVQSYVAETDHDRSSTVIGTPLRLSPANAALTNGTAAHALEVDDGYT